MLFSFQPKPTDHQFRSNRLFVRRVVRPINALANYKSLILLNIFVEQINEVSCCHREYAFVLHVKDKNCRTQLFDELDGVDLGIVRFYCLRVEQIVIHLL